MTGPLHQARDPVPISGRSPLPGRPDPERVDLFHATLRFLGWQKSLWRKVAIVSKGPAFVGIAAFTISQVSLLVAFILPLKILMLAGARRVPSFLTPWVTPDLLMPLISVLALGTLIAYLLHLGMEKVFDVAIDRGSARLIRNANKLFLFQHQTNLARDFYATFCRAASSLVLVTLFVGVGLLLNSTLFALICVAIPILWTLFAVTAGSPSVLGRRLSKLLRNELTKTLNLVGAIIFLMAFMLILWQLYTDRLGSTLVALVCLLLLRQLSNRLTGLLRDSSSLWSNQNKINAMFYTRVAYTEQDQASRGEDNFLSLLKPGRRQQWLTDIMREYLDTPVEQMAVQWLDSGVIGMAMLRVSLRTSNRPEPWYFFMKLYAENQAHLAAHERAFLETVPSFPLAPSYLFSHPIDDCELLVSQGLPEVHPEPEQWNDIELSTRRCLLTMHLDAGLVDRARRTRPFFYEGLTAENIERLILACGKDDHSQLIQRVADNLPSLRQRLMCLPICIENPALKPANAWLDTDGAVRFSRWERWVLEPAGVGIKDWMLAAGTGERLLEGLQTECPFFQKVTLDDLRVSAALFRLVWLINKQQYATALELASNIDAWITGRGMR